MGRKRLLSGEGIEITKIIRVTNLIRRLVQSVALDKLYDELICSPFYDLT
ncbi:hypothetical protein [Desulfobacter postgatei]|nr:hypothetical protein [uncultured Desulfobacter sp.]